MKHIPTLTIVYYKDIDAYGYRYDDINGDIQENGTYPTLDSCAGNAVKHLKSFTLLEGIEEA